MKLKLIKDEILDNWYQIVREEHDGKVWLTPVGNGVFRVMMSQRLSPEAAIEGTSDEMIAIAEAIKKHETIERFAWCAVASVDDGVQFWSPRNSYVRTRVPHEDAIEFAEQVLNQLKVV